MRHLLLLLWAFPFVVQGQDLDLTTKVIFNYNIGHYNFGETGQYAKEEIIEFTITPKQPFALSSYKFITKAYIQDLTTKENNFSKNDTITNSVKSHRALKDEIYRLTKELNTMNEDYTLANILPSLTPLTKKEVLSTARKLGTDYWFIDEGTNKVDDVGKEIIKKIQRFEHLDTFLSNHKPSLETDLVVTDAWNSLKISFVQPRDTVEYHLRFYSLFGQPVYRIANKDTSTETKVINLNINKVLVSILPKNSLAYKSVDLNSLKESYINWFMANKKWKK